VETVAFGDIAAGSTLLCFGTNDASGRGDPTVPGYTPLYDIIDTTDCQRYFCFARANASSDCTSVITTWSAPVHAHGVHVLEVDGSIEALLDLLEARELHTQLPVFLPEQERRYFPLFALPGPDPDSGYCVLGHSMLSGEMAVCKEDVDLFISPQCVPSASCQEEILNAGFIEGLGLAGISKPGARSRRLKSEDVRSAEVDRIIGASEELRSSLDLVTQVGDLFFPWGTPDASARHCSSAPHQGSSYCSFGSHAIRPRERVVCARHLALFMWLKRLQRALELFDTGILQGLRSCGLGDSGPD
jgi:hypothetical protein